MPGKKLTTQAELEMRHIHQILAAPNGERRTARILGPERRHAAADRGERQGPGSSRSPGGRGLGERGSTPRRQRPLLSMWGSRGETVRCRSAAGAGGLVPPHGEARRVTDCGTVRGPVQLVLDFFKSRRLVADHAALPGSVTSQDPSAGRWQDAAGEGGSWSRSPLTSGRIGPLLCYTRMVSWRASGPRQEPYYSSSVTWLSAWACHRGRALRGARDCLVAPLT